MNVKASFAICIVLMLLLFSCTSAPAGHPIQDQPVLPKTGPWSILVMPPVNLSPDVRAPVTFLATSTYPLAESGYYVIPVALSDLTFKQNGITVAEEALLIEADKLREIFGADAALYITISRFGTRYRVISSVVEAAASAKLIELRSGRQLWSGNVSVTEGSNTRDSDLLSLLIVAAIDQITNVLSDRAHDTGKQANRQLLSAGKKNSIPYGPYYQ